MTRSSSLLPVLSPLAVRLAGLWMLAGALSKLFLGNPMELPEPIRDVLFGPELNFRLAIAVELALGTLTLLLPRIAWPFLTAVIAVFLGLLVKLWIDGAEDCGCFGSRWPIPPWGMIAIDGALLVAMLSLRPWSAIAAAAGTRSRLITWVLVAAIGAAAPFLLIRKGPEQRPYVPTDGGPPLEAWSLPPRSEWPPWRLFQTNEWKGKTLFETDLYTWYDLTLLPTDNVDYIFWRNTCTHCLDHFQRMAMNPSPTMVVLVELEPEGDKEVVIDSEFVAQICPPDEWRIRLPEEIVWALTTPQLLEVRDDVIQEVWDAEMLEGR